jgi:hypothetical protein
MASLRRSGWGVREAAKSPAPDAGMNDFPPSSGRGGGSDVGQPGADDFSWPSDSDTLLPTGAVDPTSSADLDWLRYWARGTATFHALGFREAAELLAPRVGSGAGQEETLVFPFALCWRHHLELAVKMLISQAAEYVNESLSKAARSDIAHSHDLANLWGHCRPLLERIDDRDSGSLSQIHRLFRELSQLDPHPGTAFRYPTGSDGLPTLAGVDRLDVRAFHEACLGLSNALGGWSGIIDDWQSAAPTES